MKLSEYMRKGIELSPTQIYNSLFDLGSYDELSGRWIKDTSSSCALGAALIGKCGKEIVNSCSQTAESFFPEYENQQIYNPVTKQWDDIFYAITYLNDYGHWSREKIADWLESEGL